MKMLFIIISVVLWSSLAFGATYTIGPGQTYTTFTLLVATETLTSDDIVDGGGNTFTETWTLDGAGTVGHPITLRNAVIDATGLTTGIYALRKDYITVTDIEVKNANNYGIWNRGGDGWVITLNTVHNIGVAGDAWPCEGISVTSINLSGGLGSAIGNTVSYNTIYQIGRHGIEVSAFNDGECSGNIVEHNTIYNTYHSGIDSEHSGDAGTVLSGNIFRYNHIYANSDYSNFLIGCNAIYAEGNAANQLNSNLQIYYNVIHDIPGKGIQLQYYITNATVYNNTIANRNASYATECAGLEIDDTGSSGIIIKNNIVSGYDNAGAVASVILSATASSAANVDYNMWYVDGAHKVVAIGAADYHQDDQALYKAAGYDVNAPTWANPLFISTSDFHLQSGSPCINAGVDVGLTIDCDGNTITGLPDIGAFEYFVGHRGFAITGGSIQ